MLIAGLPNILTLRQLIEDTLIPAKLLGEYTIVVDGITSTVPAIAVVGIDTNEADSRPEIVTGCNGLEVVITPGEDLGTTETLDGYISRYETGIVLKQWDVGYPKAMVAFSLLQPHLDTIKDFVRMLPTQRFDNIETVSFVVETTTWVEVDGVAIADESLPEFVVIQFTIADVIDDTVTLNHNLNGSVVVDVFDGENVEQDEIGVTEINPNQIEVDLTGQTVTGTWKARVERV